MINDFFEIFGTLVEIIIAYFILDIFFLSLKNKRKTLLLILLHTFLLSFIIYQINHNISLVSILTPIITYIYVTLSSYFIFEGKYFFISSFISFYLLIIYYNDLCCITFTGLILNIPDYLEIISYSSGYYRNVQIIVNHVVLVFLFTCLYYNRKKILDLINRSFIKTLFFVSCIGFLGTIYLIRQTFKSLNADVALNWIILGIFLFFILYFMHLCIKNKEKQQIVEIERLKNEALTQNYENLIKVYQTNARLYHDFNNHMQVLSQILAQKKYKEAESYLNNLSQPLKNLNDKIWTGNDIIDIILNKKILEMDKYKIKHIEDIEYPLPIVLDNSDLCSILTNLLDNAVEACNKNINQHNRWIRIVIKRINSMIYIKISNGIEIKPKITNNHINTTKRLSSFHGWGLDNVKRAVEKYDGILSLTASDTSFEALATLNHTNNSTAIQKGNK